MTIIPLGTRVVIEPTVQADQTETGLYIPESAKGKPQTGKVIAIGDEVERLEVGQKYSHTREYYIKRGLPIPE